MRTTFHYFFSINRLGPTTFFEAFSTSSTSAFVASIAPSKCITIVFESTPSGYLFISLYLGLNSTIFSWILGLQKIFEQVSPWGSPMNIKESVQISSFNHFHSFGPILIYCRIFCTSLASTSWCFLSLLLGKITFSPTNFPLHFIIHLT